MIRRDFLKRLTMTAAGLLVADDALAMIAEPRRFWPGADFGPYGRSGLLVESEWAKVLDDMNALAKDLFRDYYLPSLGKRHPLRFEPVALKQPVP